MKIFAIIAFLLIFGEALGFPTKDGDLDHEKNHEGSDMKHQVPVNLTNPTNISSTNDNAKINPQPPPSPKTNTTTAPPDPTTTTPIPTTKSTTSIPTSTTAIPTPPPTTQPTPPPTTQPTPTTKPTTPTTNKPTPTPSPKSTTTPPASSTVSPDPARNRFDGPSFIGGIVLSLGLVAIGFIGFKYYKARSERNYRTL